MNQTVIRTAILSDSEAIASVHVQSWKETYPGIMPAKRLEDMSIERSSKHWQANISGDFTVLVSEVDGQIIGFASGGENCESQACETGLGNACDCELGALYILGDFHRRGIGKALFNAFVSKMRVKDYATMVVWVAEKNKSTQFYEAMGGELVDRKIIQVCDEPIPVLAYRYIL